MHSGSGFIRLLASVLVVIHLLAGFSLCRVMQVPAHPDHPDGGGGSSGPRRSPRGLDGPRYSSPSSWTPPCGALRLLGPRACWGLPIASFPSSPQCSSCSQRRRWFYPSTSSCHLGFLWPWGLLLGPCGSGVTSGFFGSSIGFGHRRRAVYNSHCSSATAAAAATAVWHRRCLRRGF